MSEIQPQSTSEGRVEVIYLTYGEPAENRFMVQYRYSLAILHRLTLRVAPIPKFVLPLIAAYRAWTRVRSFTELDFHSPLEQLSEMQREALEATLRERHPHRSLSVRLVYEFRQPFLPKRLEEFGDPPAELILLPSYIAESDFTSGVSRTDLATFHRKSGGAQGWPLPKYVNNLGRDPRLAELMVSHILSHCRREGWNTEDSVLVLGAHGTVVDPPPGILNGLEDTAALARGIRTLLDPHFRKVRVGFLNHVLGGEWTQPAMDQLAEDLRTNGGSRVVYYPFGFTTDNAESLVEGPEALGEQKELLTVPCLNESSALTDYLADRVEEAWQAPGESWEAMKKPEPEEPAPPEGEKGWFRFRAPTLAWLAAFFWIAVGVKLLLRGAPPLSEITGLANRSSILALAVLITYFKGYRMLGAMAKKNLIRLRRLPQPSPVYQVFPLRTYVLIAFFGLVGMGISLLLSSAFAKAWILLGVGGALFMGGLVYLFNLSMSRPKRPPLEVAS